MLPVTNTHCILQFVHEVANTVILGFPLRCNVSALLVCFYDQDGSCSNLSDVLQ